MADAILNFLQKIITDDKALITLISMFPLIELKGAIPIGIKLGSSLIQTALLAYVGSTAICVLVYYLLKPLFALLKKVPFIKKFVLKVEAVLNDKAENLAKNSEGKPEEVRNKMLKWGLFIFVAVPFPVTGVWTGTAIAVFLNMKFKDCILPLCLGNLIAGGIITLLTFLFSGYVDLIIYILFAIAIIMLIIFIVKIFKAKTF